MRVQVKQLDIERGEQGNGLSCPVARAIRRALRKIGRYPGYLDVNGSVLKIFSKYDWWLRAKDCIALPKAVNDFVTAFDGANSTPFEEDAVPGVAPFTFTMRRPT
jgi:hypothetical protein